MSMTLVEKITFFRRVRKVPATKITAYSISRDDENGRRILMRHLENELDKNKRTKIVFFAE